MRYFKLDENRQPVEVGSNEELWEWRKEIFGTPICSVGRTPVGKTIVSTVFLGKSVDEAVLPFETLVYDDSLPAETYATWEEAEVGHKKKVEELINLIIP